MQKPFRKLISVLPVTKLSKENREKSVALIGKDSQRNHKKSKISRRQIDHENHSQENT